MTETTEAQTAPIDLVEVARLARLALTEPERAKAAALINEKRRVLEQAKKESDAEYHSTRNVLLERHSTARFAQGDAQRARSELRAHYVPRPIVLRFEETAARVRSLRLAVESTTRDMKDAQAILSDVKKRGADVPIVEKAAKAVAGFKAGIKAHAADLKTAEAAAGIARDALNSEMKALLDHGKEEKPKRGRKAR